MTFAQLFLLIRAETGGAHTEDDYATYDDLVELAHLAERYGGG